MKTLTRKLDATAIPKTGFWNGTQKSAVVDQREADYQIVIRRFVTATIEGPLEPLLILLGAQTRSFTTGGPLGYQQVSSPESFLRTDSRERLCLSPGLVQYVTGSLREIGLTVEVSDRRKASKKMNPNARALERADELQQQVGEAMLGNFRGQLALRDEDELMRSLAVSCRLFSRSNILILTATLQQAKYIWRTLRSLTPYKVRLVRGRWFVDERDIKRHIVVCPYAYLRNPSHWQLVLFADAQSMTGGGAAARIETMLRGKQRVYAFRNAGFQPGHRDDLMMQMVAGPLIYSSAVPRVDVYAMVCPVDSFPRADKLKGLDRKRKAIWANDWRNRVIAAIADAFARKCREKLWEQGLFLGDEEALLSCLNDPPRVCILVESTEHAAVLKALLPTWSVVHAHSDGVTAEPGAGTIVTLTYAATHTIDADIIIRAEDGPLQIKGFPPAASETQSGPVILVDIDDEFDDRASRQTQRRLDEYVDRGWHTTGARQDRDINAFRRLQQLRHREAAKMLTPPSTVASDASSENGSVVSGECKPPQKNQKLRKPPTIVTGDRRDDGPARSQAGDDVLSHPEPGKASRGAAHFAANRNATPYPADIDQSRQNTVADPDHIHAGSTPSVLLGSSKASKRKQNRKTPDVRRYERRRTTTIQ